MAYRGEVYLDTHIRKVSLFVTFDQVSYLLEGLRARDQDWISEGLELLEEDKANNFGANSA